MRSSLVIGVVGVCVVVGYEMKDVESSDEGFHRAWPARSRSARTTDPHDPQPCFGRGSARQDLGRINTNIWSVRGSIYDQGGIETTELCIKSYDGIQTLEEWTLPIQMAHYFATYCPCNWGDVGLPASYYCSSDRRWPVWWWERWPFSYGPPDWWNAVRPWGIWGEDGQGGPQSTWDDAPADADSGEGDNGADSESEGSTGESEGSDTSLPSSKAKPFWIGDGTNGPDGPSPDSSSPPVPASAAPDDWTLPFQWCNQTMDGVQWWHKIEPVWPLKQHSKVMTVTTYVGQEPHRQGHEVYRATSSTRQVDTRAMDLYWVTLSASNYLYLGFKLTYTPNTEERQTVTIEPSGYVGYGAAFWPMTYNYEEKGRVYAQTINYKVLANRITVYANTDALVWYDVFVQHLKGYTIADIALQNDVRKQSLSGYYAVRESNWATRWDSEDLVQSHHGPIWRLHCGEPNDLEVCRHHLASDTQRHLQRIYGTWEGFLSPYVNRTIYDWNKKYEHEDPSQTDWDQRHNCPIRSQTTLEVPEELEQKLLGRSGVAGEEGEEIQINHDPKIIDFNSLPPNTKLQDFDKTNYYKLY